MTEHNPERNVTGDRVTVKMRVELEKFWKAVMGSRCIALLFLQLWR